jgi:S1-C subfamily serine protease
VVGVNSAIYSPSGAFAGIGFSIPIDSAKRLVPQLIDKGAPVQPGIGASFLSDALNARLGVEGAVIYEVSRGQVAAQAGLSGLHRVRHGIELGDRITRVDGKPIKGSDALLDVFENAGVGATVVLTVVKGGATREVKVSLQAD